MKKIKILLVLGFAFIALASAAQTCIPNDTTTTGNTIVQRAMKYLGVPYRSGQSNPKIGFDCSGFTSYVFKKENILLTRSSRSQYQEGLRIHNTKDLQLGDLVFFSGPRRSSSIGHVGIVTNVNPVTGAFSFIHASRTGIRVSSSQEVYYMRRYIGACRILA